ncbi:MAG: alanine dehydrogenase [Proteobacteria bacterium]|nr:alanine dehydrogenase [Pseudomonadota bacterium]
MLIGSPKEIKNNEFRIGLTPTSVRELTSHRHQVLIENDGGLGSGFSNADYEKAGAIIAATASEIFERCEMIVKVKEPQPQECRMLSEGQILFTYLHLAADAQQCDLLLQSGCAAVAYETVTDAAGGLPLLAPMSAVAGRLSVQMGCFCLEKPQGGRGVLIGGVPGVAPAKVVILGGGVVGYNAALVACGMGGQVRILDKSLDRLERLHARLDYRAQCLYSTTETIESCLADADMVIGAVLVAGASAPKLVRKEHLAGMLPGSVLVDVAIDQGGCFETSHPTTHQQPTFVVDEVVHYCVANMPGATPRTSALALNNATIPCTLALADQGLHQALLANPHLANGLNIYAGKLTSKPVAESLNKEYTPTANLISQATQ